jgi:hypothetical protein
VGEPLGIFCFLSLFCSVIDILFSPGILFIICGEEKIFNVLVQNRIPFTRFVTLFLLAEGNLFSRP